MTLSEIDRNLLERCLARKPRAWEDFVDRFMGLIVHVVYHTAQARGLRLPPEDRDDLVGEVFVQLLKDEFAVLRHFRGHSSLATYLAVVARRIVVRELMKRPPSGAIGDGKLRRVVPPPVPPRDPADPLADREEIERLLGRLDEFEAEVVRMYHLEGRTYRQIGAAMGIAENSVGPVLSRARAKMHRDNAPDTTAELRSDISSAP